MLAEISNSVLFPNIMNTAAMSGMSVNFKQKSISLRAFTRLSLVAVIFCYAISRVSAEELPVPTDPVILTVLGNISNSNTVIDGEPAAEFDLPMLESLDVRKIETRTPWTEGVSVFEGLPVQTLLDYVGAGSSNFTAWALDEYTHEFNSVNFASYPIIIAYKLGGEYIPIRELGPLWIMFPFDSHPELLTEHNKAGSVWQLHKLRIR